MVSEPRRGEIWWGEIEDVGRRPFLVMSRSSAVPVLNGVLAAPVTRTVRNIPTEVRLEPDDGPLPGPLRCHTPTLLLAV